MRYDPLVHHRRSIRLKDFDYASPGAYFVTICTQGRECLLGEVGAHGRMCLSDLGRLVQAEWQALPRRFPALRLDAYVVMPNHLHGLLIIVGRGEASAQPIASTTRLAADASPCLPSAADASPLHPGPAAGTQRGSLAAMVQNFKAVSTRRVNRMRGTPGSRLWQRNYWEHVVRDAAGLERVRGYIQTNPVRWEGDQLYVSAAAACG